MTYTGQYLYTLIGQPLQSARNTVSLTTGRCLHSLMGAWNSVELPYTSALLFNHANTFQQWRRKKGTIYGTRVSDVWLTYWLRIPFSWERIYLLDHDGQRCDSGDHWARGRCCNSHRVYPRFVVRYHFGVRLTSQGTVILSGRDNDRGWFIHIPEAF